MGAWGGQWNESDITGTCAQVSIFIMGCVHPAGLAKAHESEEERGTSGDTGRLFCSGEQRSIWTEILGRLERVRSPSHWRDNTFVTFGIRLRTDMI